MDAELDRKLDEIRAAYVASLPQTLSEIDALWDGIRDGKNVPDALRTLRQRVHNLAGSGTIFGFSAVSDIARELECALDSLVEANAIMKGEPEQRIGTLLEALGRSMASPDPDGRCEN